MAAIVGLDLRATGWMALVEMLVVVVGYAVGPAILSRHLSGLPAVGIDAVAAIRVSSWKNTYRPLMRGQVVDGLLDVGDHRRDIGRILSESQALLLVAEDGNHALAGFALSHIGADGEPFLESLHVQPGRRSHGIGAQLLQQTAARWAARGHRSMSLHVVESNLRAKRFYDRLGGREVGVVVDDWRGARVTQAIYRWNDLAAVRDR